MRLIHAYLQHNHMITAISLALLRFWRMEWKPGIADQMYSSLAASPSPPGRSSGLDRPGGEGLAARLDVFLFTPSGKKDDWSARLPLPLAPTDKVQP